VVTSPDSSSWTNSALGAVDLDFGAGRFLGVAFFFAFLTAFFFPAFFFAAFFLAGFFLATFFFTAFFFYALRDFFFAAFFLAISSSGKKVLKKMPKFKGVVEFYY